VGGCVLRMGFGNMFCLWDCEVNVVFGVLCAVHTGVPSVCSV